LAEIRVSAHGTKKRREYKIDWCGPSTGQSIHEYNIEEKLKKGRGEKVALKGQAEGVS